MSTPIDASLAALVIDRLLSHTRLTHHITTTQPARERASGSDPVR